jgi:S1-C subfamily serine protease
MIKVFQTLLLLLGALLLSSCATILSGGPQSIEVRSDPPAAQFQYGTISGITPATVNVSRKDIKEHQRVEFKKDGYEDLTVPAVASIRGIVWLNLFFWPGLLIDVANSSGYELDPPYITASLVPIQKDVRAEKVVQKSSEVPPPDKSELSPTASDHKPTKKPESGRMPEADQLQTGVVKIIAKSAGGSSKIGTGFIVRLERDAAYIVTAAHVVAGDPQPKVEFFTKRNVPVPSEVLGLEGDDEVRGLALLTVRGQESLPKGLKALHLTEGIRFSGGEDILIIGFPRNAGPWAFVKGNISSRQGRDLYFSPAVDSGHSGGPILRNGEVVGVVAVAGQSSGRGVIARSVHDYVEGFGVTLEGHVSSD